jgi:hypothetical protein
MIDASLLIESTGIFLLSLLGSKPARFLRRSSRSHAAAGQLSKMGAVLAPARLPRGDESRTGKKTRPMVGFPSPLVGVASADRPTDWGKDRVAHEAPRRTSGTNVATALTVLMQFL